MAEAEAARDRGEVPVGAVVVDGSTGAVLARAGNGVEAGLDPTAHAEMLAIRAAAAERGTARLVDCDIYVTLEPCAMCAQAIAFAPATAALLRRGGTPRAVGSSTGRAYFNSPPATTGPRSSVAYKKAAPPSCSAVSSRHAVRASPSLTGSRQAATAARRPCGALAEAPAAGRLP